MNRHTPDPNEHVVLQDRDATKRSTLWAYNDIYDAERGYPVASAGPSHAVHIEPECDPVLAEKFKRLSSNELVQDPWQDLSWVVTHTRDGDGYVTPITGPNTLGGAA